MSEYDYTGYESAFVPTPASVPESSPEIERKTEKPSTKPEESKESKKLTQGYKKSKNRNVLNFYRSITYNFTLAGLPSDYLSDPTAYRKAELGYVILKSGGKSFTGITPPAGPTESQVQATQSEVYDKFDSRVKRENIKNVEKMNFNTEFVKQFNIRSPGRFDMFIDNVEIQNLMTFTQESNTTLPTKVKFEVIEPYSVNGFIEALHAASLACGYTSYVSASFVLKVEFWGIPDDDTLEFKKPVKIPNATRYIPLALTKVEVELTDRGTKYSCSAVPYNERAFGQPSVIKKPIKMQGEKVGSILTNFINSFNDQIKKSNKDGKASANEHDEYAIKFVEWDTTKGWVDAPDSEIAKSDILNLFEDNVLYGFANPKTDNNAYKKGSTPKSIKYNPKDVVINFPENKSIHEVIAAVIRDSEYVRNLLKDMADKDATVARRRVDDMGFVKYFMIKIETENKKEFDKVSKKPYQKFTFVVSPYKVHFTRIPTYGSVQLKEEEFLKLTMREYNYFYMGNNVDVLNFKLNFNNLYFEAIPASMADQNTPNYRDSAKPDNRNVRKVDGPSKEDQSFNNPSHPMPPVREVVTPVQPADGSAIPAQNDPYSTVARSMHESIINSKASMVTGDIEILGDPFYLVTGGMGNYNPIPGPNNEVGEGEAPINTGELNISINFRNPVDIDTFENGGVMYFSPERVPFSGVYMVTKVVNTFKEGVFRQKLDIIRKPGQILDENVKEVTPAALSKVESNPDNKTVVAAQEDVSPSFRLNQAGVDEYLNRGAPDVSSNFTGAVGGLDGTNPLSRTYGLVSRDGLLKSSAGVIGQTIPNDISSNIRLNVNNLASMGNNSLSSAALINAAANVITGNKSAKAVAANLAGNIIGTSLANILKKSNVGSGIGDGASVAIPSAADIVKNPTALDIKSASNIDFSQMAQNAITNVKGVVESIGSNSVDAISRLGDSANGLVGNIKNKIDQTLSSVSDPGAIAAKVGLDSARLSGLSDKLQSKVSSQISSLQKLLPENVNLSNSYDEGLALDAIPPSKFQNIPPSTPYKVAPSPDVVIAAGAQAVQSVVNFGQSNKVDLTIAAGKISTVKSQLSTLINQPNVVDANIGSAVSSSFGSKVASSPLNQLMNKFNNLG